MTGKNGQISVTKNFFAGGFGGICLVTAGHPLDTVKVRLQTMSSIVLEHQKTPQYSGTFDCVRKILTDEGPRGFFKGMATPLVGITPLYSIAFFGYSLGKKLQTPDRETGRYSHGQIFNAGMLSSVCTNLITTPGERIKCLLQIQATTIGKNVVEFNRSKPLMTYRGPIDCAIKLYRDGGLRSLYRGTVATLWRDVPAGGAYFVTYESLKHSLNVDGDDRGSTSENFGKILLAGGTSGIVYWIFALPFDVVKSRLQTSSHRKYPNGMRDVGREILKSEGLRGFYTGGMAVFLRAFPANASCFLGYEAAMKVINWLAPDL
ncbi:Mitochondrial carnitine/acylcarnitine carrier protein [Sarcoptes scabiei]|uniref:Mitochondrial carnitine/acylcarnitine carrier protein n=1 Tax=Sarcoptes scabiei TaxID=52283 RepID=A0A132AM01_SARSC|nr:Mitochondrial carnitine/acylcarnitine carrier protein [Sarcoptes scabiei]KPM11615.1 mitochondrial carnitine/acylcarnitine carrier protein-like protein [Sarcoptes scabiei]